MTEMEKLASLLTEAETKNLYFALKRRLEIYNVIPIRGNGEQK